MAAKKNKWSEDYVAMNIEIMKQKIKDITNDKKTAARGTAGKSLDREIPGPGSKDYGRPHPA